MCGPVFAQTTEFTYQGSLKNSSIPASGNYDFEFALFDAVTGGTQILMTITKTSVLVTDGIFAVKLDFGNQFSGANRFLEIRVRQTGGGAFTPLSPRQAVTSAPYSVKSLTAENANTATFATNANFAANAMLANTATNATTATNALQLGGVTANQFVQTSDLRLSDARTPTAGSTNYIQNSGMGPQPSFDISGYGAANFFNAITQYNINGNRVLSVGGTDNLFAGVNTGQANTTGAGNSFFGKNAGNSNIAGSGNSFFGTSAGVFNQSGGGNTFVGVNAGNSNLTGNSNTIIGFNANVGSSNLTNATALGAGAVVSTSNTIVLGRFEDTVLAPNLLQVNTLGAAGTTSLCRNASNQISTCSSSIRYKQNINPFVSGLSLIKQLRPVSFNWKANNQADLGLVAEDVAAVEPLLTTVNEKGETEGVKYDRLGVVLVIAVQEQQIQIEAQQKEIVEQKQANEAQQKQFDAQNQLIKLQKAELENAQQQMNRQKSELEALKALVCSQNPTAELCKKKE